jgi:predicted Zn-ribbon and HTH transcriptional regulator
VGIDKYPLDRMRDKDIKLSFDCPYCLGHRIEMNGEQELDYWTGVRCPKCKTLVVLDSLSVVTVREALKSASGTPG